jgi:outer membrane protein TolC
MRLKILFILLLFLISKEILFSEEIGLDEAISIALKNNYLISQKNLEIIDSEANLLGAKSTKRLKIDTNIASTKYNQELKNEWSFPEYIKTPPITANGTVNVYGINFPVTVNVPSTQISLPQPQNIYYSGDITYTTNISLKQPIYTFGKLEGMIEIAKKNKNLTYLERDFTTDEVILEVKRAYYNYLKVKSLYNLAKEIVKNAEEHLKDTQLYFKLGKVPEFDVIKAKINLDEAKSNLITSENALNLAKTSFNIALGINNDKYEPKYETPDVKDEIPDLQNLISSALKNRKDLEKIKISREIANTQLKVAKANKLPSIGIGASYNLVGYDFPPKNKSWNISLLCSLNLYDSGETKSKEIQARTNILKLKDTEENIKQKIIFEIKQAYFKLIENKEKIKILGKNIEEAKTALNIANIRYNKGLSDSREVLDAQILLRRTEANYIQSIYDYKIAEAELYYAVGKGK